MDGSRKRLRGTEYERLVLAVLKQEARPLSAYEITAALKEQIRLAPQTVYRALDKLIKAGHAHKLESLNAFTVCQNPDIGSAAGFAICDSCGSVAEFAVPTVQSALRTWSDTEGFALTATTLELHGLCSGCKTAG